jgi:hypothetical protein
MFGYGESQWWFRETGIYDATTHAARAEPIVWQFRRFSPEKLGYLQSEKLVWRLDFP